MSEIFDAARACSTMREPCSGDAIVRVRTTAARMTARPISEAIFPVAARHDIRPRRTSGLALPMEMLRPLRSSIAISLSPPSMTAISSSGTAKSFTTSGNATLLAVSPSTPASLDIV